MPLALGPDCCGTQSTIVSATTTHGVDRLHRKYKLHAFDCARVVVGGYWHVIPIPACTKGSPLGLLGRPPNCTPAACSRWRASRKQTYPYNSVAYTGPPGAISHVAPKLPLCPSSPPALSTACRCQRWHPTMVAVRTWSTLPPPTPSPAQPRHGCLSQERSHLRGAGLSARRCQLCVTRSKAHTSPSSSDLSVASPPWMNMRLFHATATCPPRREGVGPDATYNRSHCSGAPCKVHSNMCGSKRCGFWTLCVHCLAL